MSNEFFTNGVQILTTTDGVGNITASTQLGSSSYTTGALTSSWADTHTTIFNARSLQNNVNPEILAVKKAVLVVNDNTTPTASIGIEADNSGGIGTYYGMNLFNSTNLNFGITSTFPYDGSVVFDQEGVGSTTTQTAIKQGTITISDTATTTTNTLTQNSVVLNTTIGYPTTATLNAGLLDITAGDPLVSGLSQTTTSNIPATSSVFSVINAAISTPPLFTPNTTAVELTATPTVATVRVANANTLNNTTNTLSLNALTHNSATGTANLAITTNGNLILTSDNLNTTTTTMTQIGTGVGYTGAPNLSLRNTNTAAGNVQVGVPALETFKEGRNAVAGDHIFGLFNYAKNASGLKFLYSKIEATVRNTGAGNDDGSMGFWALINGSLQKEFFRINGDDGENNCFAPLDMNNNAIKTNTGDLTFSTTSSTGTGEIQMLPKADQGLRLISSADTNDTIYISPQIAGSPNTNQIKLSNNSTTNTTSTELLNKLNEPKFELKSDIGGSINTISLMIDPFGSGFNKLTAIDNVTTQPFQIDTSGYTNGSVELKVNDTTGDLLFTGTNIESGTSGGNSGQHLRIKLNGTYYKIKLEDDI